MAIEAIKFIFINDTGSAIPSGYKFFVKLKDGVGPDPATPALGREKIKFSASAQTIGYIETSGLNYFMFVVFCVYDEPGDDEDKIHSNRIRFRFDVADYLGNGTWAKPNGIKTVRISYFEPNPTMKYSGSKFKQSKAVTKNSIIIGGGSPEPPNNMFKPVPKKTNNRKK